MPDQPPRITTRHTTSRRGLLAGVGAVMATSVVAATGGEADASPAKAAGRPPETAPECLSDLVAMGVVTHDADFVAR